MLTAHWTLHTENCTLHISNYKLHTEYYKLKLHSTDCTLHITKDPQKGAWGPKGTVTFLPCLTAVSTYIGHRRTDTLVPSALLFSLVQREKVQPHDLGVIRGHLGVTELLLSMTPKGLGQMAKCEVREEKQE